MKKKKEIKFGFLNCKRTSVKFYLMHTKNNTFTGAHLVYRWIPDKNTIFQLINIGEFNYSWLVAEKMCKQNNMRLPHLQNEKSTKQFVSYVLK